LAESDQPVSLRLVLTDDAAGASELQSVTRELATTIDRQDGIGAALPEGTPQEGKKGDFQAIGSILLQLAASGGVIVSLIGVLKTWLERKPTLDFELQRADGAKLKLHAENLQAAQTTQLRDQIQRFLKGGSETKQP
jgi:hypothetical protein